MPTTPSADRYKHQADYSLTTIHTIINTSPVLHISLQQPPNWANWILHPGHVVAYRERCNGEWERYAEASARKDAPVKKEEEGEE